MLLLLFFYKKREKEKIARELRKPRHVNENRLPLLAKSRLRISRVPTPGTKPNPPPDRSPPGIRSGGHGARSRRRRRHGGAVARGGVAGVPAPPGPRGAAHGEAVGGHARGRGGVRAAGLLRAGLLRGHLRAGHLPAQPPHRLPLPHGRPGARGARRWARAPHPRLRRVQALHPPPPRVQVLVCHHESLFHCFRHDLLLCIRCSCLLANTSLLLDCALCPDNEATDFAYDQVQVCSVQLWKADVWRKERPSCQCTSRMKTFAWWQFWRVNGCVICEATILLAWWNFEYQLLIVNAHRIG